MKLIDKIKEKLERRRPSKKVGSLTFGVEVKRCDECERVEVLKIEDRIREEIEISSNYGCEGEYRAGLYKALEIMEEEAKR